jgi:hypothetical protein
MINMAERPAVQIWLGYTDVQGAMPVQHRQTDRLSHWQLDFVSEHSFQPEPWKIATGRRYLCRWHQRFASGSGFAAVELWHRL